MKRILLFTVFALIVLGISIPAADLGNDRTLEEAARLFSLTSAQQQQEIDGLSKGRRAELAAAIKRYAKTQPPEQFNYILLHLGDEDTIKEEGRRAMQAGYSDWNTALRLLKTCHELGIIEQIAPALFSSIDEDDGAHAVVALRALGEVIHETPGLKPEVYDWLKQTESAMPYYRIFALRDWWKANEAHFKKRDYLAVQPGPIPPPVGLTEVYTDAKGKDVIRLRPGVVWPPPNIPNALRLPGETASQNPAIPGTRK